MVVCPRLLRGDGMSGKANSAVEIIGLDPPTLSGGSVSLFGPVVH